MEVKKSPKADLVGKKSTGLLIGYVLILAVMFVAFEWTDRDKQVTTDTGIVGPIFEEEMIPITEQEEKQPEQAPPPEAPKVEEVLQIADNDANVQETDIASSEETGQAVKAGFAHRLKILDLRQKYYASYSEFLTQKQIQRVYELERQMMERLSKRSRKANR